MMQDDTRSHDLRELQRMIESARSQNLLATHTLPLKGGQQKQEFDHGLNFVHVPTGMETSSVASQQLHVDSLSDLVSLKNNTASSVAAAFGLHTSMLVGGSNGALNSSENETCARSRSLVLEARTQHLRKSTCELLEYVLTVHFRHLTIGDRLEIRCCSSKLNSDAVKQLPALVAAGLMDMEDAKKHVAEFYS
eukprot:6228613-Prymnesium_polylepis.3